VTETCQSLTATTLPCFSMQRDEVFRGFKQICRQRFSLAGRRACCVCRFLASGFALASDSTQLLDVMGELISGR
jgi:hypothetical protein